jgi:hypothetical protein
MIHILLVLVPGHSHAVLQCRVTEEAHTGMNRMSTDFVVHTVMRADIKAKQTLLLFLLVSQSSTLKYKRSE